MRNARLAIFGGTLLLALAVGAAGQTQTGGPAVATPPGPFARIAFLKSRDGNTVDFEAGYARHLEWHRQAGDPWTWFGWTIWAGERQRWLVYATFGHSAAALDAPISPAEDERDNVANVVPHAEFMGSALYEFRDALSRGSGEPTADARIEMTTVDLAPGSAEAFEAAIARGRAPLAETLWYRMIAGGPAPRYVRLRPRASLAGILEGSGDAALAPDAARLAARITVEILNLRPTLSYGLPATK